MLRKIGGSLAEEALVFAKRRGLAAAVQGAYSGLRLGLPRSGSEAMERNFGTVGALAFA
ncbi:hypothetical protein NST99_03205 [Paenibacillus sp. FSL L8-0470]|uniref:hypothetical protein n=1 Tax=unclassified Paenibacillus TaxID=185978 RepID=UPI0030F4F74E